MEESPKLPTYEMETDPGVLSRRAKQIEYGKNTTEYYNYTQAVPKKDREQFHPKTPNKHKKYSRRAWDGLVKQWRLNLHCWSDIPVSATSELGDEDKLNLSFNSESTASTTSTSSSTAAVFTGITLGKRKGQEVKIKREDSDDDLENTLISEENQIPKSRVKKETFSKSWAEEVEEYDADLACGKTVKVESYEADCGQVGT